MGKILGAVGAVAGGLIGGPAGASIGASIGGALGGSSSSGGSSGGGVGNVAGGAIYDPFAGERAKYSQQLSALMANPSSVTQLPGYQFGMQQGEQALNRSMAATGQQQSGQQQIGLSQYGQQYAGQFYQQSLENLKGLSGATQSPQSVTGANQLAYQQSQDQAKSWGQLAGGIGQIFNSGNNSSYEGPSWSTSSSYAPGYVGGYSPTNTNIGMGGYQAPANFGGGTIGPSW